MVQQQFVGIGWYRAATDDIHIFRRAEPGDQPVKKPPVDQVIGQPEFRFAVKITAQFGFAQVHFYQQNLRFAGRQGHGKIGGREAFPSPLINE